MECDSMGLGKAVAAETLYMAMCVRGVNQWGSHR